MLKTVRVLPAIALIVALLSTGWFWLGRQTEETRILVFSRTEGFRHDSIESGVAAIEKLGEENGIAVDATEDAGTFTEQNLKRYRAVVFLNTTGDVLDEAQQSEFERFIQAGGGYVGIHAATDTEYDWPWYGRLVGAYFESHPNDPNVRTGTFRVMDKDHVSTEGLPDEWEREDEFYNFRSINPDIRVLVDIDETTYEGGTNGDHHPMSWYHEYDGGRAWYTGMGHTVETFSEPLFLRHLIGGIRYAVGNGRLDYSRARPEENRFTKVVLAEKLNEPLELAILPDERVLFIERGGAVNLYSPASGSVSKIATIPVNTTYTNGSVAEDGLVGLAADPAFTDNGWIYLYYSPAGDEPKNVLARFTMQGDSLDLSSGTVVLEVPVQRDECCHTGGSVAFDAQGNLYLSTGDNTNPHATGFAPTDERPGRAPWDAQKSSANTNDLRGKILRIRPQADGSYAIPEGNLFAPGTPKTRPEIYTMGHRNPYRISVDQRTGFLYWGDIGPDARRDSVDRGPAGHDEFNQARRAGNFGWPYFAGDNKAYFAYDFKAQKPGESFDPARPVNRSPNNTGLTDLPPAEGAFIWYPAGPSEEFPSVGTGGRSAMAGPVFYREDVRKAARPFPAYYEGKLFLYEWMRGWIMTVTMNEDGDLASMERFMPGHRFSNPVDMAFGPSGDLYVLEYGTGWFSANDDARLVRIEYNAGNRKPAIRLAVDRPAGATPLRVALSSAGTTDADGDELRFEWTITSEDGKQLGQRAEPSTDFTFDQPGLYTATLTVTDAQGASETAQTQIVAGNEPPQVEIDLAGSNRSFFFPGAPIRYAVRVTDSEDGSLEDGRIAAEQVAVTADYLKEGFDQVEIAMGHRSADASAAHQAGRRLVEEGTCLSCHKLDQTSIGPSYQDVAAKYRGDAGAAAKLATKIRDGGSGVWGEVMMPPHPQLSESDAERMAAYILSLAEERRTAPSLPVRGTYEPPIAQGGSPEGVVVLRAAYTDRGANGLPGASGEEVLVLRAPTLVVATGVLSEGIRKFKNPQLPTEMTIVSVTGSYARFEQLDLTGISEIRFVGLVPVQLQAAGGKVEVRIDSANGPLLGETPPISSGAAPAPVTAGLQPTAGLHDVFFVFRNDDAPAEQSLFILLTAEFVSGGAPAAKAFLSTRSRLRELLASEKAKGVLERYVPGMTTHPQLMQALEMSLRDIAPYMQGALTEEVLEAMDEELGSI